MPDGENSQKMSQDDEPSDHQIEAESSPINEEVPTRSLSK